MTNFEHIHIFLNMFLAFGAALINFIYTVQCRCTWKWLKLFYGINCMLVGFLYIWTLWFHSVPSIPIQNCVMTLLLLNIFAGGLLSMANLQEKKRQSKIIEEK